MMLARKLTALLFILALCIRVGVPQGYMLAKADDGLVRITICSGQGAVEMGLDRDGKLVELPIQSPAHGDGHPDKPDKPCPFALAAAPASLPDLALPERLVIVFAAAPTPVSLPQPGRGLAAPPPPATGPPAIV